MGAVRPFITAAQTLALVWTVAAALGPVPRFGPALAVSAGWLLWQWAFARWPRWTVRAGWLTVAIVALLVWLRPVWAPWPAAVYDTVLAQWQDSGPRLGARGPVGYGVTALPLLVLAQLYYGQFPGARGNSREALRAIAYGLTALLLVSLYNWPPVLWGCLFYVPLALAYAAHTRAEELSFARYRGDVRRPLLAWGAGIAMALLLATLVLPDWSAPLQGASWRPQGKPPVVSGRIPMPGVDDVPDARSEDIYPLADGEGLGGEGREPSRWLVLYLAMLLAGVSVPAVLLNRWANRRGRRAADGPAPSMEAWPDFPSGPWPGVIVQAFLWLVARLSGRRLRPGLTASEHVAVLSARRPALAGPLQRMLGQFLPVRYGRDGQQGPMQDVAGLRHDWETVREHLHDEAIRQANPGWSGRLLVAWQRMRHRGGRRRGSADTAGSHDSAGADDCGDAAR